MRGSPRVIGICLGVCVSCVVMLGVKGDLAFAQAGDGFVAVDVAVSGPHVYSVGLVGADPRLIMLDAMGDGTFSVPRGVRLSGPPTSIAVFDIDLDGLDDVVVTESGGPSLSGAGALEVFTGHFLSLGEATLFDRSDVALLRAGGDHGKIATADGSVPLSATVNRFDGDTFGDIAYVTGDGAVDILYATDSGFGPPLTMQYVSLSRPGVPAPRLIASGPLNWNPYDEDPDVPHTDVDLVVATSGGDDIFQNVGGAFWDAGSFAAGSAPLGILAVDMTRDHILDFVTLDAVDDFVTVTRAVSHAGSGWRGSCAARTRSYAR